MVGGAEGGDVLVEDVDHYALGLAAVVLVRLEIEGGLGADDGHENLELFHSDL